MYAFKGFAAHAVFQDNAPGEISTIGEISKHALTYSRESGQYVINAAPGLTLISFLSSLDGTKQVAPPALAEQVLLISKFVYDRTFNNSGEQFGDELYTDLVDAYSGNATEFAMGQMVNDSTYWMPEWLSWRATNLTGVASDNTVRIWFSDASFRLQYDEYEITVVPPTDNLDDFFKTPAEVDAMLKSLTQSQVMARMQQYKGSAPETVLRSEAYDYIDPFNPVSHRVPSNWGLLIYGEAGNNVDAISDTLVNYILANSTHSRADWVKILPDLFKRTEVIIVPRWDVEAIPARESMVGIFSPIAKLTSSLASLKAFVPDYPEAHINSHAETVPNPFRSMHWLVVGGPDNRDNKFKFTDWFPDYVNVSSQSLDFNRMSVSTKKFMIMMESLLLIADAAKEFTSLPQGTTRVKRNGKLYVVRNFENVNYLVAVRNNFAT